MSAHLHNEIEKLKKKLLYLATMAEQSVQKSIHALTNLDASLAKDVIMMDHQIDLKEVEIEEDCLKILALHNPVANDLRFVVSSLKINNELERIGDLAVNIAERTLFLCNFKAIEPPFDFNVMSEATLVMLKQSLDSLIHLDTKLAHSVCAKDDDVDTMNRECYDNVYARLKTEPEDSEGLINYVSISRHLERVADYATNIAEYVIYMIEGRIIRHNPDYDYRPNQSLENN